MQKSRWEQLNQLSGRSKWLLAGGVVVIVLLLQITTFYMGYNQGWDEGSATPPQQVILQSDEKAMKTLAEFMADSVSGPDALIDLIQHRNERLAWIHDEELRADVAWGLGRELLAEGKINESLELMNELMQRTSIPAQMLKWAKRSEVVGAALLANNKPSAAIPYFERAAQAYQDPQYVQERVRALQSLSAAYLSAGVKDKALQTLNTLRGLATVVPGEEGKMLAARSLAAMGRIERSMGDDQSSKLHIADSLKLWPEGQKVAGDERGGSLVIMGEALVESGRLSEAAPLFLSGLKELKGSERDLEYRLSALRNLGRISMEKGDRDGALSYLHMAEGVGMGQVPDNHSFWSCLYDQMGWVQLRSGNTKAAITDFTKALNGTTCLDAQEQSLEGIGSALLDQGQSTKAQAYLQKAIDLRLKQTPIQKESLGRLYKSLGMAFDLEGKLPEAVDAYSKSFNYLKSAGLTSGLVLEVAQAKAQAQTEYKQWADAVETYRWVIPYLTGERKSEVLKQLAHCYDALKMKTEADACWKEAGFPRVAAPVKRGKTK